MKDLRPVRHYSFWGSARETWNDWPTWNRVVVVIGAIFLFSWMFSSPADTQPRTQEQIRDQQIQEYFNGWSGAHEGLEQLVKSRLSVPESYEHLDTRYWDKGDHLIVNMNFQAKNEFGVTVNQFVKAKTSTDGKVLEIIEAR